MRGSWDLEKFEGEKEAVRGRVVTRKMRDK